VRGVGQYILHFFDLFTIFVANTSNLTSMSNFFHELQRRNVIKASISYAVIGWAVLQVADILFPAFEIPDTAIKYILYTLIGGFPIWVVFAYVYEWTPTGFKKTTEVAEEASVYQQTGKRLNVFIIGGMALAIVLLITDRVFNFTGVSDPSAPDKSIAVLPFENMSSEEDAYFAKGVTEDILTHISQIGDLRVLSNFTLRDYDAKGKTIEQIGKELGVGYLLTGSIRKAGEQLRISCQLVQVNPEEQEWAENYDKRMDDIFAIQTQVAEEVASKLQARLSPQEKAKLSEKPTENIVAYNIYLKGREEYNTYEPEAMKRAIAYFKEAIALDPSFGLAYAGLADTYNMGGPMTLAFLSYDYLDTALSLGEKAVDLSPNAAETWKAWAFGYHQKGDYDQAIEKYQKAISLNPNYVPAIGNLANIFAITGRIDEAVPLLRKNIQINPLRFRSYSILGQAYLILEMFEEAEQAYQQALALNPRAYISHYNLAWLYDLQGQTTKAKQHLESLVAVNPDDASLNELATDIARGMDTTLFYHYARQAMASPDFDPVVNFTLSLGLGQLLWETGQYDSAQAWVRPILPSLLSQMEESDDSNLAFNISTCYASIGEKAEALRWLRKALDLGYMDRTNLMTVRTLKSIQQEPEFKAMMDELDKKLTRMRMNVSAQEKGTKSL
jgi:adenylate cyclase